MACFALLPGAQAVCEDGCNNGLFNTWQGDDALINDTTGAGNSAFGWRSLFSNTDGSFNTGIGGGALVLNNGASNTAVGAAALLLNTTGTENTAVGTDALAINDSGIENTAVGKDALIDSTGSGNIGIGFGAGAGITTVDNNIIVGNLSGVHSVFGQQSDSCFIDKIYGEPVSFATVRAVLIDSDGKLGTFSVNGSDPSAFAPDGGQRKAIPQSAKQAMLILKVQALEVTVAELRAQLKEQAAQIQKVSAQLEMNKPAAKVVVNKP